MGHTKKRDNLYLSCCRKADCQPYMYIFLKKEKSLQTLKNLNPINVKMQGWEQKGKDNMFMKIRPVFILCLMYLFYD